MIFIAIGVFIGVLVAQTYSLPNITESLKRCSKLSYGENQDDTEDKENIRENEPGEKSNID